MAQAIVGSNPTLSVCNTRNEVGAGLVPAHILLCLHFNIAQAYYAPVAQWIRASDYGSEGQGFESSQALDLLDKIWTEIVSGCDTHLS